MKAVQAIRVYHRGIDVSGSDDGRYRPWLVNRLIVKISGGRSDLLGRLRLEKKAATSGSSRGTYTASLLCIGASDCPSMGSFVGGQLVLCRVHSPYNGGDHAEDIAGLGVGGAIVERERGVVGTGLVDGQ